MKQPTLSPHRQRKHDAMIQSILGASRSIMREQGVAALSLQEIANRLDLRPPSLYHYFASKMEIYDALFRLGFIHYGERLQQAFQGVHTWQELVRTSFETYFLFAKDNPDLYQLCFERPIPGFVPSEESLQVSFGMLESAYQQMADLKQQIDTDLSAQQLVDLLIAISHGITAMHMSNEPDLSLGQGRFGSLVQPTLDILQKAWSPSAKPGGT